MNAVRVVFAPLPVRFARSRYFVPGVPLTTNVENEQMPFPFAVALVPPLSDAPFNDPLSNSGSSTMVHVPDAVDAH